MTKRVNDEILKILGGAEDGQKSVFPVGDALIKGFIGPDPGRFLTTFTAIKKEEISIQSFKW